jgi:hypothetical protein
MVVGGTSMKSVLDRAEETLGRTFSEEIREKFNSYWVVTVKNARTLTQEQWDKLELPLVLENEIKVLIAKGNVVALVLKPRCSRIRL